VSQGWGSCYEISTTNQAIDYDSVFVGRMKWIRARWSLLLWPSVIPCSDPVNMWWRVCRWCLATVGEDMLLRGRLEFLKGSVLTVSQRQKTTSPQRHQRIGNASSYLSVCGVVVCRSQTLSGCVSWVSRYSAAVTVHVSCCAKRCPNGWLLRCWHSPWQLGITNYLANNNWLWKFQLKGKTNFNRICIVFLIKFIYYFIIKLFIYY